MSRADALAGLDNPGWTMNNKPTTENPRLLAYCQYRQRQQDARAAARRFSAGVDPRADFRGILRHMMQQGAA